MAALLLAALLLKRIPLVVSVRLIQVDRFNPVAWTMATLDDKLLGEKLHYYCSSSEDEREVDDDEIDEEKPFVDQDNPVSVSKWDGSSCNVNYPLQHSQDFIFWY